MEEAIKKIVNQRGFFVEAVLQNSSNNSLVFEKEELLYPQESLTSNLMIRVTREDGRMGVSSCSDIKNWKKCFQKAKLFSKHSFPDRLFKSLPSKSVSKNSPKFFDKTVRDFSSEELLSCVNNMVHASLESGVRIQSIVAVKDFTNTLFANSEGVFFEQDNALISTGISVVKNGIVGSDSCVFSRAPDFSEVARNAVNNCLSSQKPIKIREGEMPLIMEYDALNSVFYSTLLNAVDGYSAFKEKSFFTGRTGELVCSEKFTLSDEPLLDYGLGSRKYDSEGVPSRRKIIIGRGVIKSFLQDYYTTGVLGGGVPGNCESILSRPSIGPSNLMVKKGSVSRDKLLAGADKAILVREVSGEHMINTVSGDFSNECVKAFVVNRGELTPVKKVMISGNVFALLNELELVGNDLKQKSDLVAPTMMFSDVQLIT